jgi:streptomycin 6-kinase
LTGPADQAGRLADLLARWGASDPRPIAATPTSRVLRVRLADGRTAIVKDLTPIGVEDELAGAAFLAWRDGRGAVRLLAREGTTLLLEDAGDRSVLEHLDRHGDAAATEVLAGVVTELHAGPRSPPPADLQPLEKHLASLFAAADADRDRHASPFVAAADLASSLLDLGRAPRPLHGDLHHDNVFAAPRGWLAIDPKGLFGDPAYDVANLFYNPLDRDDLRLDPTRIRSMARALADALDRDPADVLGWAIVDISLSAAWHTEDRRPDRVASDLRVVAAIRSVLGSGRS